MRNDDVIKKSPPYGGLFCLYKFQFILRCVLFAIVAVQLDVALGVLDDGELLHGRGAAQGDGVIPDSNVRADELLVAAVGVIRQRHRLVLPYAVVQY